MRRSQAAPTTSALSSVQGARATSRSPRQRNWRGTRARQSKDRGFAGRCRTTRRWRRSSTRCRRTSFSCTEPKSAERVAAIAAAIRRPVMKAIAVATSDDASGAHALRGHRRPHPVRCQGPARRNSAGWQRTAIRLAGARGCRRPDAVHARRRPHARQTSPTRSASPAQARSMFPQASKARPAKGP